MNDTGWVQGPQTSEPPGWGPPGWEPPGGPSGPPAYGPMPGYGPPPAYGPMPGYGVTPYAMAYAPPDPGHTLQLMALIFGVAGLVVVPLVGPAGIILGHMGRRRSREAGFTDNGLGLAGIICGWIATAGLILFGLFFLLIIIAGLMSAGSGTELQPR